MNELYLEGRNSIESVVALDGIVKSLDVHVEKVSVYQSIMRQCKQKGIPVTTYSKKNKKMFQGIAALCKPPALANFDDLKRDVNHLKRVLVLDHLEDPYNFAAIIRTSLGLGYDGLIFAKDRAAPITAGMLQASAGTLYLQKLYQVSNVTQSVTFLKKMRFWIYGSGLQKASPLSKTLFNMPYALLMGNESKGLSSILQKQCHEIVKIEQESTIDSLNASAAAAIIMYKAREKSTESDQF